jgi:methyltransferase (TIGR00027 family)
MAAESIQDVSDTALLIAAFRARESARPDALFSDPLAARLAGARGQALADAHPRGHVTAWMTAIRTVIIDEMIRARVAAGCGTVLNLGAGLDTRPYRLPLPAELRWIEADYPHLIARKEEALAGERPICRVERVGIDLADTQRRRAFFAGVLSGAGRALVLTEGVLPYLDLDQAGGLASDLRARPEAADWIVDYFAPQVARLRGRSFRRRMENAPFKFVPADWAGFFAERGWRAGETIYVAEEADRRGRPIPLSPPVKALFILRALLSPAARKLGKRYMGYVALEPAPPAGSAQARA